MFTYNTYSQFFLQFIRYCIKENKNLTIKIIKITISSIVIGLKNSNFPLIDLPICYQTVFFIGQFVIGQFVIGQFNKPITFKVVV